MNTYIQQVHERSQTERMNIINHSVYSQMTSLEDLRIFMQFHVFAVWDFMSLLKSLQITLTCVELPWIPIGNANTRYLINEIVTGEESDVNASGERMSHFEMYLSAMHQVGADSRQIQQAISFIREGNSIQKSLEWAQVEPEIADFVLFTFEVIATQKPHILAAVFTFGREDLIPDMFMSILREFKQQFPDKVEELLYYLERHIEVDGDHHSHLAVAMTTSLCGDDPKKWEEATEFVKRSLAMRCRLWDGVYRKISE